MLPLCILVPTAFLPAQAPTPALLAPALGSASLRTSKLVMMRDEGESAKAGFIASIAGSVATAPVKASALLATNAALTQQWQANTVSLAVMLSFFGIVYRYAVRDDDNDMLKSGAVMGFVMCHTLSSPQVTQLSSKVSSDQFKTWMQLAASFGESFLAFGLAAAALEYAFNRGWVYRLPGYSGLPQKYDEYYEDSYDNTFDYRPTSLSSSRDRLRNRGGGGGYY